MSIEQEQIAYMIITDSGSDNFIEHSDYISLDTYSVDHGTSSLPSQVVLPTQQPQVDLHHWDK